MNWNRNSRSYNLNEAFVLDETHHEDNKETIKKRRRSDSLSSVEDDEPAVHPRGLPTRAHSIDFGLDEVDKRKPCRDCLLGCFVVFFVLALMTCVAIILYFVLINTVFTEKETKTLTGALTVEGSLLLNETYHSDLADPQSMAYREMENEFLSSMNASFSSSSLADIYDGAQVERFEQGSVRIIFTIFLLSAPNDADTEAEVIFEVQVTIGDGISSGFFDEFDVIEDSLEITLVNQESRTTTDSPTTVSTEALGEQSTTTTVSSVTSQMISAVSTLLSTPVTTTATTVTSKSRQSTTRQLSTHLPASPTVALTSPSTTTQSTTSSTLSPTTRTKTTVSAATVNSTNIPSTTRQLSAHLPTSPTVALPGPSTTTQSTPSTFSPTTATTIQNSSSTFNRTTQLTTIPLSSTDLSKTGTTLTTIPSTRAKLSTTSSTTVDNATGSFNFTVIPTTTPPFPSDSPTTDTTSNTTPFITRMISATTSPTAAETTTSTTTEATVAMTNNSLTNLTTRPTSSDSPTSTTTPTDSTTAGISSPSATSPPSPAAEMNITRQPKIHPALPDICGIRPALNESDDGTARIVGGTQSAAGTWPWMGSLRQGGSHQCGAVLIHPEWAITAHHCIGFFDNIVLGDIDLYGNTNTSPYRVQRNVQTFSNPDFNPVTDEGDIALVRLTEPVEFNDHVQPLCINTLMTEMRSFDNCFVTGWGTDDIDHQVAMRYLQEASIQMFDRGNCSEWYQSFHTITTQHICAGEEDGRRDACSGDSGGPLQCQDDQGIWYLLGVVSFGQDCGQPRLPGVYTRISTQISFLSQILDTNVK